MNFLKKALFFFFVLTFLFTVSTGISHAQNNPAPQNNSAANPQSPDASGQNQNITPDNSGQVIDTTNGGPAIETDPPTDQISDATPSVKITFHGMTGGDSDFYICTGDKECTDVPSDNNPAPYLPTFVLDSGSLIELASSSVDQNNDLNIELCGDGTSKVKPCTANTKDYFWGGNFYVFSIGHVKNNTYIPIKLGGFYVSRSYPNLTINPSQGLRLNTPITISLSQNAIRNGGGKNNDYQVEISGGQKGYEGSNCFTINQPGDAGKQTLTFTPSLSNGGIGQYYINVKERIHDNRNAVSLLLHDEFSNNQSCDGGFVFYKVTCTVTNPNDPKGGTCTNPGDGKDPNGEEYKEFVKSINALNQSTAVYQEPCGSGTIAESSTNCPSVQTAIGNIRVDSFQGFLDTLFQFVLTIAGFGGVIIIIYAGYVFMTSRGDKEKIAGARETLTSAIVGLLFIILSIVILKIIGVDILQIPGFK